nr:hypothetical protein [Tanacetum cinerariifolium]GEY46930.1 hypothetical protein [Tanacetum cinerariifolium]
MGGSSSQPRTDQVHSPINAFSLEDLYTLDFSDPLQDNTGYWQPPNPYEASAEQVATSPTKKKKATRSEESSKRHKSTGSSSFNTKSGEASINLNSNVGDNDEDDVQEIRRLVGRDKAKAAGKKKGSKSSASSSVNGDALARLMVTEMGAQEKEERLTFLEIKRRDVECRERELKQQDIRFYLQPYDHLVGDHRKAMDEIRAKIKAKYNLQY